MKKPFIINIQKFSLHDGDGIRTTVFFKGCPLRCLWCHNPEGQSFEPEWMLYKERCIGCGHCKQGEITADTCPTGARTLIGEQMSADELVKRLMRDRQCYEVSGGGVTFSGGEVMAQDIDYIVAVAKKLHRNGVPLAIDTCGLATWDNFERIMPYADVFLYDIKAMNPDTHKKYVGTDNALILENIKRLSDAGANINIRVPVIPGVNDTPGEVEAMLNFARENVKAARVNLLPYHKLGSDKNDRLCGHRVQEFDVPTNDDMERLADKWRAAGFTDVRIGG